MNIFYEPDFSEHNSLLSKSESFHCVKVLRMKAGDKLFITNGKGLLYEARLIKPDPKACLVEIANIAVDYGKRPFKLHIAIAPTKSIDRFEWFLEKATECGIDAITPLLCEYSERKIIKPARLEKVLIAAMKQSGRACVPVLRPIMKFSEFLNQEFQEDCFIAHCAKGEKRKLHGTIKEGQDILFVVGPEGDFSENEISMAVAKGFKAISMGSHRLRTETAAVVACVQINAINELL